MDKRSIEEGIFKILMKISTGLIFLALLAIIGTILYRGIGSLSFSMITQLPKGGYYLGKEGGILNAIIGSLMIGGFSTLLALMLALPITFYINIYRRGKSRFAYYTRFSLDVLTGVPSIVYGLYGFIILRFLGIRASLLGGVFAVALLILPLMCRTIDEVIRLVPKDLMDTAYSLGSTKFETIIHVVVKQISGGIIMAVMIAFGRGIGDAASVLFTAGFSDYIPTSLFQPVATLPLAIFFQLQSPLPEVQERAYASAFILTAIILVISVVIRLIGKKFSKHVIR